METMYWLLSIDAVLRIVGAMMFFFVLVPALASPSRPAAPFLERFFWNLGAGITLLTLAGQLVTLANLFSFVTLILGAGLVILIGQARHRGVSPGLLVRRTAETAFLAVLNVFDRRVNVLRRLRRVWRRRGARLRESTRDLAVRIRIAAWTLLLVVAAAFRLYRPFASANLGYSDTYGHFYLLDLLEEGRQVDPRWGPYPVGMHFVLLAIQNLTNVDPILLVNFFGAVVGVLITLSVALAAVRVSRSTTAGLVAGFVFATLIGGPGQYFLLGGSFAAGRDPAVAQARSTVSYGELAASPMEFDLTLRAFQRQTSTLPQELAIALLFPAGLFLIDFLRTRERWKLLGFGSCTAAIAAVHSGVLIPLFVLCALAVAAHVASRDLAAGSVRRAFLAGVIAVAAGSAWMIAFIAYPPATRAAPGVATTARDTVLKYFPFLNAFSNTSEETQEQLRVLVRATPDMRRNVQWLLMSLAILLGVMLVEAGTLLVARPRLRLAFGALLAAVWLTRVPLLSNPVIHDHLVDYSGFSGTTEAVLEIARSREPFTWTLVSYGQEYPLVLHRGYHVPAMDFLERYDPAEPVTNIPTPDVFVVVEKRPHPFQVSVWARRFTRDELEQRLQSWVHVYQATHRNLTVFLEDENVRVYRISRTPLELELLRRQPVAPQGALR